MPAENIINVDDDAKPVLSYPGGDYPMTVTKAAEGNDGIELGKLLASTGYVTYDPGFTNTAPTKSSITYIDGEAGILRYRGYPIEQLAASSNFIEVSYLLIYGELPTQAQLDDFTDRIRRHTLLHEDLKRFFDGFPRNAHPMPVLSSAVNALSAYYQDSLDPATRSRSSCPPSACWPSCPPSRRTRTRSRSASRSSTPTTRCRWWRTSCG